MTIDEALPGLVFLIPLFLLSVDGVIFLLREGVIVWAIR